MGVLYPSLFHLMGINLNIYITDYCHSQLLDIKFAVLSRGQLQITHGESQQINNLVSGMRTSIHN